jgi:DNA (cytosine-5)-methyltransferase 1
MKHGSLFSGIGGFDLAAEWMGWENIFHCEIAEFPRQILKYHFPNSICYEDIKKTDFTKHRGEIDIISGGFPCQPYSNAGKRRGKEDDRHLWPEMLRVIREVQPRFVVGENVAGLLSWNNGMVFHEIITDLENEGYETQAVLIPACATNAPHRRDRIWFIAYSNNARTNERMQFNGERKENDEQWRGQSQSEYRENGINGITTDTDNGSGSRNTVQTRRTELEKLHEPPSNASNTHSKRHTSYGKSKSIEGNWSGNNGEQKERSEQTERINGLDGLSRITTHTDGTEQGNDIGENIGEEGEVRRRKEGDVFRELCRDGNATDTNGIRGNKDAWRIDGESDVINQNGKARDVMHTYNTVKSGKYIGQKKEGQFDRPDSRIGFNNFENFPTQSPICGGDDGIPTQLDGITFPKWRNESIKGYGNAVVPNVVYRIFKAIEQSLLSS